MEALLSQGHVGMSLSMEMKRAQLSAVTVGGFLKASGMPGKAVIGPVLGDVVHDASQASKFLLKRQGEA